MLFSKAATSRLQTFITVASFTSTFQNFDNIFDNIFSNSNYCFELAWTTISGKNVLFWLIVSDYISHKNTYSYSEFVDLLKTYFPFIQKSSHWLTGQITCPVSIWGEQWTLIGYRHSEATTCRYFTKQPLRITFENIYVGFKVCAVSRTCSTIKFT